MNTTVIKDTTLIINIDMVIILFKFVAFFNFEF